MIRASLTKKVSCKDNPNPKANIGFICYSPFNFYIYKNIYQHLPNAEFIVGEDYSHFGSPHTEKHICDLVEFIAKQNVHWRFFDRTDKDSYPSFFGKYALFVSTWFRGILENDLNADKKKVRVLYGHAKDPWNFGPWSAYFDLVLSYGPYSQAALARYDNAKMAGNPKFDDWFSGSVDNSALRQKLDPKKKTILYLPTHGVLSSMALMVTAVNELSKEYNIILRPHHVIALTKPELVLPYEQNPRIVIQDETDDLLPSLKTADIVLSDNSGAIFDAILGDKPVILIDFLDKSFFDANKKNIWYAEDITRGVITSETSIEQRIKRPGNEIGPVINCQPTPKSPRLSQVSTGALKNALADSETNRAFYEKRRRDLRDLAFAYNDGRCGARAAEKIKELLYAPKPPKTFFAESLDRYLNHFLSRRLDTFPWRNGRRTRRSERERIVKRYRYLKSLPPFQRLRTLIKEFF